MHGGNSTIEFRVEIVLEPDGIGFHAYCPALKGLHVSGDTEDEVLRNAVDAATAYLESLIKHGDPIPVGIGMQQKGVSKLHAPWGHASRRTEELTVACAI